MDTDTCETSRISDCFVFDEAYFVPDEHTISSFRSVGRPSIAEFRDWAFCSTGNMPSLLVQNVTLDPFENAMTAHLAFVTVRWVSVVMDLVTVENWWMSSEKGCWKLRIQAASAS